MSAKALPCSPYLALCVSSGQSGCCTVGYSGLAHAAALAMHEARENVALMDMKFVHMQAKMRW